QLKDWTRNASGRECYTVWAHQLTNPNLVELSSQKIVKQIYDNIDHKRPMFKGLLKSDLQPSDPTQPPSSSKDPKDPPSSSKDQKDPQNRKNEERKLAEQETKCGSKTEQELHAYAWKSTDAKNEERKLAEQEIKFGSKTEEELHEYAWKSTHMRATRGLLHA
ncbi:hypothetical protein PIB30_084794, partial [Stylosanthes scabra]|nr:hypothetical protein [Stylosanthes scabra]